MRWLAIGLAGLLLTAGCLGKKSALLLERRTRGEIDESLQVAGAVKWKFTPVVQTLEKDKVEVIVNYASEEYLTNFFANRKIFGEFAGKNPYYPEHLVFYMKIANRSDKKIRLQPVDFVLVDDRGNQYSPIGTDYVTAYGEFRSGFSTTTRGVLENASPGYFGFSLPVGKMFASKPQGGFALLTQSSLQTGYLYPGVVHDGLVAFWSPIPTAHKFKLLVTNIKTDFDANDEAHTALEFPFEFDVTKQ